MTVGSEFRQRIRSVHRSPSLWVPVAGSVAIGAGVAGAVLAIAWSGLGRAIGEPDPSTTWELGWTEAVRPASQIVHEGLDALLHVTEAAGLLLIAVLVANVSLAILARTSGRRHELALRVAVGAAPRRLGRHLLADALALVAIPLAVAVAVAAAAVVALRIGWPAYPPSWLSASGVAYGLVAATLIPLAAAALAALAPTRRLGRADRTAALQRDLRTGVQATAGPHEGIFRQWLGTFAVAVSVAALTAAGALLHAFALPSGERPVASGIDPHDTLTFHLDLTQAEAWGTSELPALQAALVQRLTATAGVSAASLSTPGTWLGLGAEDRIRAFCGWCGRGTLRVMMTQGPARHHAVSPGYFHAHGISVLQGRELSPEDGPIARPVAVINRSFANRYFPSVDPLGKEVQLGDRSADRYEVIGVVANVAVPSLGRGGEPVPEIYLSSLQRPMGVVGVAVRTEGASQLQSDAVAMAVREVDDGLVPAEAMTLAERIDREAAPLRWFGGLFAAAGLAALAVAAFGVFGTLAHTFERRRSEFGVRLALGARTRDVALVVLTSTRRMVLPGLWLGLLAGIGVGRLLQVLFLGVRPVDALVIAIVSLVVLSSSLLAAWRPIRVASGSDPLPMIRAE